MRYLKNKILRARSLAIPISTTSLSPSDYPEEFPIQLLHNQSSYVEATPVFVENTPTHPPLLFQRRSRDMLKSSSSPSRRRNPTKNLVINYGKAISTFAMSKLAEPYLATYLKEQRITFKDFSVYISDKKERIGGISDLRTLLLCSQEDTPQMKAYKGAFKVVSEVFIKYFSVNWIIHGRMANKLVYLKSRSKMLRRVQSPELFTYIKISENRSNSE